MIVSKENISEGIKPKNCIGVRHLQAIMIFLGMVLAHCTRTTMSIAIVDMTDPNNEVYFDWTIQRQSVILSSFNWGYIILHGFAGELAAKYGGMNFLLMCVGVNSVVSLLIPAAAIYGDWIMVCVCRGIQGLTQGTIFPTVTYLIAKWVPVDERGRLAGLILSGAYCGITSQLIVSGYMADYWGWPTIFYVNGVAGVIWTLVYLFIGSDNPQVSKFISSEERLYIQSSLGQIGGHKKLKTPWKSIFTSMRFYALLVANIGYSWGYWTLLTEIPTYLSNALQVDIKSNGVMSSFPYLTMFIMNFPIGFASDYIVKKNWISVTACRKSFNSFGFFGAALSLYCLTYVPPGSVTLAVVTLCVALGFNSGYYGGFMLVYLDMAHNFSNTLLALTNVTANFLGLFAPLFARFIVKDENDPTEWHIVFYVSSATYVVANIFFLVFASSEQQPWNQPPDADTEDRCDINIKA